MTPLEIIQILLAILAGAGLQWAFPSFAPGTVSLVKTAFAWCKEQTKKLYDSYKKHQSKETP
jgi:hypothetical protein